MKIFDIFSRNGHYGLRRHDGDFGIEIETESEDQYKYPKSRFWDFHPDNSLRHFGVEYVLKAPMSLDECGVALKEFKEMTSGFKFLNSMYTSVHVHINMLNETFLTMANTIVTYILLENALLKYSGPQRESNLFCLSSRDADGSIGIYEDFFRQIDKKIYRRFNLTDEAAKYAALNIVPITKFGSIESRSFRGSHDIKEIFTWLKILSKLKDFARIEGMNPVRIVELAHKDPTEFYQVVLGDLAKELNFPNKEELLKSNLYSAAKLARASKDWAKFGYFKPVRIVTEVAAGKLDDMAVAMYGQAYAALDLIKQLLVEEQYIIQNAAGVFAEEEDNDEI